MAHEGQLGRRSDPGIVGAIEAAGERARALHASGIAANHAGHPVSARRQLRAALAAVSGLPAGVAEHDELRARIWISLATAESELQGAAAGFEALAEAEHALTGHEAPDLRGLVHMQRGYMHVRGGALHTGLAELDLAVALIDFVTDDQAHAVFLNRGTARLFAGDLRGARTDLRHAVTIADRTANMSDLAMAEHNLGYLEYLAGNLALALRIIGQVLERDADISRAVVLLDHARVLIEAGLHREADASLREAGVLFSVDRLWKDVGEVELARAECALADGEVAVARRLAGSARDRFRRRRNDRWRRDAELLLLQADLAAGRPGSRLAGPALRLAAEYGDDGLLARAKTARLIAAEAMLSADRVEQARLTSADAGANRPEDPISTRLHARTVRARIRLADRDRPGARREIRTGLAELARYRARFGSLDLQTASAVHGRQLVALDLQLSLADRQPAAVLAAAERGRALSSRMSSVVAPDDERSAELLAELRQLTEELRLLESDPTAREQVAAGRRRTVELQGDLRARAWQAEGEGDVAAAVPITRLSAELAAADACLVCYVESGARFHAVVVRPGTQSAVVDLAATAPLVEAARRVRADLDVLATGQLPAALRGAVQTSLRRALAELDDALLAPCRFDDEDLVVVPTGVLGALPWGLLPSLRGRSVTVAPSGTAWVTARGTRRAVVDPAISVLAGPGLGLADAEADGVRAAWPQATTFRGAEAGQEQLMTALHSDAIVHIAAHGHHQAENPLFSSVRLDDGPVFAYQLDRTGGFPAHVVLSACELGQATIRPGDEALGLTSVLLHLGAQSVVSSVARVFDEVSADVMRRYHRGLAGGLESARALAEATSAANADGYPAPFVNFGSSWGVERP